MLLVVLCCLALAAANANHATTSCTCSAPSPTCTLDQLTVSVYANLSGVYECDASGPVLQTITMAVGGCGQIVNANGPSSDPTHPPGSTTKFIGCSTYTRDDGTTGTRATTQRFDNSNDCTGTVAQDDTYEVLPNCGSGASCGCYPDWFEPVSSGSAASPPPPPPPASASGSVNIADATKQTSGVRACDVSPTLAECKAMYDQVTGPKQDWTDPPMSDTNYPGGCVWGPTNAGTFPLYNDHNDTSVPCMDDNSGPSCVCLPSSPPSPPAYEVTTTFSLGGAPSDYGDAEQTSIKKVIATDAGVAPSDVTLTLTAGSVIVTATIAVIDESAATSMASSLASGALVDASTLQTALQTQFTADGLSGSTVTVEAITTAPTSQAIPTGGVETNVGAMVGGIVGGCFVPVLMFLLWMGNVFAPKCPSPCAASSAKPAAGVVMTATNDKSAAAAASESAI